MSQGDDNGLDMGIDTFFIDFSDLQLHLEQTQGLILVLCEADICKSCTTMKHWRGSLYILEQRISQALDEITVLENSLK